MAFRRSYARRSTRRSTRRARTTRFRRSTRRSTPRRSILRRTSRRRILNITSRKKRDVMLPITNIIVPRNPTNTTYSPAAAILQGNVAGFTEDPYIIPWVASARDMDVAGTATEGMVGDEATRTSSACYIRGLKENIEIQVSDGVPWQWRRLVFTAKGLQTSFQFGPSEGLFTETSSGFRRLINETRGSNLAALTAVMFRGQSGTDWNDYLTAPVDTRNITLMYDKTRTIASGNEQGMIREYKMWHPVNKTLVYGDDQNGGDTNDFQFSTLAKPGCGDIYVVDIFRPRVGAGSTSQLRFHPAATFYWHER